MDVDRIRSILGPEGITSKDLFCTVHANKEDRIAVLFSSHPFPERLDGWQPFSQGIVGYAATTLSPYSVSDVALAPDYLGIYPDVKSEFAVPIIAEGKAVAVVNFESTRKNYFTGREQHFEALSLRLAAFFNAAQEKSRRSLLIPEPELIGVRSEAQIKIQVATISDLLLQDLSKNHSLLYQLDPGKFESVVAKILEDQGFLIETTPLRKDGGFDILAEASLSTGTVLTLVECKKWSSDNPVSVKVVRNLYGVLSLKNATNAMLVTTSRFTRGARCLADTIKYKMSLRDYDALCEWLKRYRRS